MIGRRKAKTLLVFLLFFIGKIAVAQPTEFNFNNSCIEAAKQISKLRLKSAAVMLQAERERHPNNCAVDYLENFIDFYSLITSQDIRDLHALEKQKNIRIDRLNQLPKSSPYKLYAQAEINLQWAFSRVFHQEYFTAALEFRDAYKLLETNRELFPFFGPNFKDVGMLKAMLGGIPDNFKWVLNIVGMKGDFKQGMDLLINYIDQHSYPADQLLEKQSAEYYYSLLQLNFGDKQIAWNFCEKATRDFETNLLSNYLRAFVGIKTAHNDLALEALFKRPATPEYATFPYMDYLTGAALLNKLQENAAIYFKKFVSFSKGKNLIKDAYKKLSWHYLIHNDKEKSDLYLNMVLKYGVAASEEDKLAVREASLRIKPNLELLKARLLFDGGYFDKATVELLKAIPSNIAEKLEFEYRYGRITGEQKQYLKAIEHYQNCIRLNVADLHLHYAPASCNQLGAIYEQLGNKSKAVEYYEKTLTYKGYDYKNSTATKARNALQRINQFN